MNKLRVLRHGINLMNVVLILRIKVWRPQRLGNIILPMLCRIILCFCIAVLYLFAYILTYKPGLYKYYPYILVLIITEADDTPRVVKPFINVL